MLQQVVSLASCRLVPLITALGIAVLLLARTDGADQQGCGARPISGGTSLSIERRADHPLIADATVDLAEPAAVFLEYGNAAVGWLRTPTTGTGTSHRVPLLRLRARTAYETKAFVLDDLGCPALAATAEFSSGDLPRQLGKLVVEATGQHTFPLALMDIRVNVDDLAYLLAFDQDSQLVWYYDIPLEIRREVSGRIVYGLGQLPSGNLLYLARDYGVEEITPDGQVVQRIKLPGSRIHHDLTVLPDGRVLFIGAEELVVDDSAMGGRSNQRVRGDTLSVLDLRTQAQERVWGLIDSLDFSRRLPHWREYQNLDTPELKDVIDWGHMNSVNVDGEGNVLVSLRHLDQIVSLSADFKTVQWKLGGPDSSFTFPDPADKFYGQHTVSRLPDGRVLMFDNGNFRPEGNFSRALELELDFSSFTARKVWEYRAEPDVFADRVSSVSRLPNGGTLVSFGFRADGPDEPIILAEAARNGTTTAWQSLRFQGARASRYRAYPFMSLGGEIAVQ